MRSLALLFALAGCLDLGTGSSDDPIDACSAAALATERCVTANLHPSAALMGKEVTQVTMWVIYSEAGVSRSAEVVTPMEKPSTLPVVLGLHLPIGLDNGAELYAEAQNGPGTVAVGKTFTEPEAGVHLQVDISMTDWQSSGCFDRAFSSTHETDVDCGTDCPPCALGQHCIVDTDCQSGRCNLNSSDQEVCQ
jgi:hypothetical protein